MFGLRVTVSEYALVRRWVFPVERFVQYGPEDERWCRYFGIGHEVTEPGAYQVGDTLVVHPVVWAALERHEKVVEAERNRVYELPPVRPGTFLHGYLT